MQKSLLIVDDDDEIRELSLTLHRAVIKWIQRKTALMGLKKR